MLRQGHRWEGLNVLPCHLAQVPWITRVIAPWGESSPFGQRVYWATLRWNEKPKARRPRVFLP